MNLTTTEYLLVCLDRQIFLSPRSIFTLHGREGKGEENKVSSRNSNYSAILPLGSMSDLVSSPAHWNGCFLLLFGIGQSICCNYLKNMYFDVQMNKFLKCPQKMCSLSQNPVNHAYRLSWEGQGVVHLNLSLGSILCSGLSLWNRNIRREKVAVQVHLLLLKARHTSMQYRLYLSQPIILLFLK